MKRVGVVRGDQGVATVFAAILIFVLVATLWLVLQVGTVVLVRHRAEGAADLAALAAAAHAPYGQRAACDRARVVVDEMRGELTGCRLLDWDARVRVHAEPAVFAGYLPPVTARARAGPV